MIKKLFYLQLKKNCYHLTFKTNRKESAREHYLYMEII